MPPATTLWWAGFYPWRVMEPGWIIIVLQPLCIFCPEWYCSKSQLSSHLCTVVSEVPDFITCLLCNSLDSSTAKTHLQAKNANMLLAEILMDEKINILPPLLFVVAMVTGKELKHQSLPFPDDGLRKLLICLIERQVMSLQLMLEGSSWGEFQPPGWRKLKHLLVH